jgi:hypothetical protein
MRKLTLFVSIVVVFTSCGQNTTAKNQSNKDTITVIDDPVTPDIRKLRKEYILSYNKPIEFESLHTGKQGERIKVLGKYYCLFDSAIVVPGKYNYDDTTKTFMTHNFAEDIIVVSNNDTILKKTITKNDFINQLPQYLKDYAVIFEPKFEGYDSTSDTFAFDFSVSIPLTDVGQLMILSLRRSGEITVKEGE